MKASQHLDSLLALIRLAIGARCVTLFLPDGAGMFQLAASVSEGPDLDRVVVQPGKGLVGWIVRKSSPLVVDPFDPRHSSLGYGNDETARSVGAFMGVPMPGGGALCVDSAGQHVFAAREQYLLKGFAHLCAQQLSLRSDASSEQDIRRYFEHLEEILLLHAHVAPWRAYLRQFLDLLAKGSLFPYTTFASLAEGSDKYTIEGENTPLLTDGETPIELPLSSGVVGWVFRNDGPPLYVEGLDGTSSAPLFGKIRGVPEFRAVICLPVVVNKGTCGALCLASETPCAINDDLRSFTRLAMEEFSRHLDMLCLRHKIRTLLPQGRLHRDGAVSYDPDTAPTARIEEDE